MAIHRHEINEGTSDYASPATPGGGEAAAGGGRGRDWERERAGRAVLIREIALASS